MSTMNRQLEDRVCSHFGVDSSEIDQVPDFVFDFMNKFVQEFPNETEFLFEAAEPNGDPSKGGNGFGIATCAEENCLEDILLTADPDLPDGGRSIGLGSIDTIRMHVMEEPHILTRDKRIRQEKRKEARMKTEGSIAEYGSRPSMAQLEKAASQSQKIEEISDSEDEDRPTKGPARPRWAAIRIDASTECSETEVESDDVKPIISMPTINKGKGKGKAKANHSNPIVLSSDDDDLPIRSLGVKRRRELKTSSSIGSDVAGAIKIDSDSDGDVKPVFSSTPGSVRRKQKQMRLDRFYSGGNGSNREEVKPDEDDEMDFKPRIHLPYQPAAPTSSGHLRSTASSITAPTFNTVPAGQYYEKEEARQRLAAEKDRLNQLMKEPTMSGLKPLIDRRLQDLNAIVRTHFANSVKPWLPFPSRTFLERIPGLSTIWADATDMHLKRDESERLKIDAERAAARLRAQEARVYGLPGLSQDGNAEAGPSFYQAHPGAMLTSSSRAIPSLTRSRPENEEWDTPVPAGLPAREEELAKFFEDALNGFAEDETVSAAATKLGLASMDEKLPSMTVTLMPHQVIGVAWMLDMERHPNRQGGILADSMGLGKTIQMIATIAENPSQDRKRKTTLIIAPVALLQQWEDEIRRFVKPKWKIHLYHGKGKISLAQMRQCDVILTSFGHVAGALPSEKPDLNNDSEEDMQAKGDLLKMKWYRVCVDEASYIRNSKTKAAKAIYELRSTYRWILSGTLVVNTLVDLYSPFYFLNISELSVWANFRDKIKRIEKRRPDLAVKRIQAVLKYACKRRTADSKIDGQPILTLPEKTTIKRTVLFDQDEQSVYDIIEARAIARFNKLLKANTVLKNYAHVLTMILRLRQVCNSVSLVVRKPGEAGHANDLLISNAEMTFNPKATEEPTWNKEVEIQRARLIGGDELVNKLIIKYQERQSELDNADKDDRLETRAEDELADIDMECAVCFEPFGDDERVTICCHSFCTTCIELVINPTIPNPVIACPLCREPLNASKVFIAAAFKPAEQVKEEDVAADIKTELNLDEKMPPSTKMIRSLELVKGWLAAGPTDKVIIFSQFVAMIDLLDDHFRANGIDVATYTGQMSKDDRDEVLADFKRPEGPSVIIISTKAGGVGLNLTCANKVILIDHTWTYAATAQAVDRAWRIGQTKPVEVVELSIEKTIEARILALQERKKALADGAFGEGGNQKLGRLTLADLRLLFDRNV